MNNSIIYFIKRINIFFKAVSKRRTAGILTSPSFWIGIGEWVGVELTPTLVTEVLGLELCWPDSLLHRTLLVARVS